jgi:hypothetical protein
MPLKINGYWSVKATESDNETTEVEIDLQLSMQEKLARAINNEMNSKIISKSRTTKDVTSNVKKELAIFVIKGKRGANLESCYENINSIPPYQQRGTRTCFSGCGKTLTKIRSSLRLHNDSVDMLTFLKGYFKTKPNKLDHTKVWVNLE